MEPTSGVGSILGGILGGLAKVIMALRGAPVEVEATHTPGELPTACSECSRTAEGGRPERVFVVVNALTSTHNLRVRKAGLTRSVVGRRHVMDAVPFGGHHGPNSRPEMLRRFGERRGLPATVSSDNPLSFHLPVPDELPVGIERGRKLRVWVGKPTLWGVRVSDSITLPPPTAQAPAPKPCIWCRHAAQARNRARAQEAPPTP